MKSRMTSKSYEKSKYDKDRGVKEGSKADMARDKKAMVRMKKAKGR